MYVAEKQRGGRNCAELAARSPEGRPSGRDEPVRGRDGRRSLRVGRNRRGGPLSPLGTSGTSILYTTGRRREGQSLESPVL